MKITRIPVASHGLHRNPFNFPYLGTFKFMETVPVYMEPLRKGESTSFNMAALSRLNPTTNASFCTGRYNFKSFFVPFKYVYRPWYYFDEGTEYLKQDIGGSAFIPQKAPYITNRVLSQQFLDYNLDNVTFVTSVGATVDNNDIVYVDDRFDPHYYLLTDEGALVLKILNSLGYSPTWRYDDTMEVNIMAILSYLKIYLDYYFPNNYVGNNAFVQILGSIHLDENDYSIYFDKVLRSVYHCSHGFYDNSILYRAWDSPVAANEGVLNGSYSIRDISTDRNPQIVSNLSSTTTSPGSNYKPNNGTPYVGGGDASSATVNRYAVGSLTQYVVDSLQSLSLFLKRHQIVGGRLIDRLLASRGVKLDHDYVQKSYFIDQYDIEIDIDAVENNSNTNLGELAGKGIAATDPNRPLKWECSATDDGIFMIVCYLKPDAAFPIFNDPWNLRVDQLDFYHPSFDKLGVEYVPNRAVCNSLDGTHNGPVGSAQGNFGFLNRYYADLMDRPRLVGDFRINSRGAADLQSYHTFRIFDPALWDHADFGHSFEFMSGVSDASQYQRLFYSGRVDNMFLFLRFFGSSLKEKLPLGDSYDWDDDEFNRKVSVVTSGSQIS